MHFLSSEAAIAKILRLGSKGADVGRVQCALNERMLPPNNIFTRPAMAKLVVDNDYGPKTQAMVIEFQRLNQISIDGIVGQDTSYLLFPYIAFNAVLAGHGPLRGTRRVVGALRRTPATQFLVAQMSRRFPVLGVSNRFSVGEGAGDEGEPEGVGVEASIGPGFKHEFQPWFVLKPDEPEGAKTFSTLTAEATILRKKGLEFGGELEFSRQLFAREGSRWIWEGTISGKYTGLKTEVGPVSLGISPIAEAKVREGLRFGAALGAEAEANLELSRDLLELKVGGKAGGQLDINEGNAQAGAELTVGLDLKWDVVRFPRVRK